MPKKPQHLSIAGASSGNTKPKYSLTLHNNKYATNNGKQHATTVRDNHHHQQQQQQQQRQHLKALRLTRDVANTDTGAIDYKRPVLTGLSPADDVGVHLSCRSAALKSAAAVNSEASTSVTTTNATKLTIENGNVNATANANPLANSVMRTQNNRLWYH
ncbi:GH10730 [Drosophila grimshawi]|uniref:GH10730 n=1 Tax=Drosophila grimshawi TaxID=7222 RepID=B4JBS3_DROGR|nr:GH10730 [Drosophila grimshawi]